MTAKEFLIKEFGEIEYNRDEVYINCIDDLLGSFAKLHVKAALDAAANQAKTRLETYSSPDPYQHQTIVDVTSILNAYPLNNIQ